MPATTCPATLPATPYFNCRLFSDVDPYEMVRVISGQTIEVREMKATLAPDWSPEVVPGGFVGHCVNQSSQRYTYESDPTAPVVRIRLNSKGKWVGQGGLTFTPSVTPRKFYDYNF